MCGISGFWGTHKDIDNLNIKSIAIRMAATLAHRGPDGEGVWTDRDANLALAHRRLSIQDLSVAGAQPMTSSNGQLVITFNGEIYNFLEIRYELEKQGVKFQGHSDTEVLIEAIQTWGLESTLIKCNGMFAFALWDRKRKSLTLARDRVGKKPLYYGNHNGVLLFGSELKSMKVHPAFEKQLDHDSLNTFIRYSWISSPHCIYKNTHKLIPGSYINFNSPSDYTSAKPVKYWSAYNVLQNAITNRYTVSIEEAEKELEAYLIDAVRIRMIADVEVGALLSGGIDSSIVTALMQKLSTSPIKTYSIGFFEQSHNEADHAKEIASFLGTDHNELYLTSKNCLDVIPNLPSMYDEPFADVSQIPTYLVSNLAKQDVKVALTGDGGDEVFAGYVRYTRCLEQWNKYKRIPKTVKPLISKLADMYSRMLWEVKPGSRHCRNRKIGKYQKIARRISAESPEDLFCMMNARHHQKDQFVLQGKEPKTIFNEHADLSNTESALRNLQYIDYVNYLTDDIMTKVDRASMSVSLETRSPLLDYRILKHAWSLPDSYLVKSGERKLLLKNLLYKYIPKDLVDRPKQGFGVPIHQWLKSDLNEWANDLLSSLSIKQQGIFDSELVSYYWDQQQQGCAKHDNLIWSLLMFQAWHHQN